MQTGRGASSTIRQRKQMQNESVIQMRVTRQPVSQQLGEQNYQVSQNGNLDLINCPTFWLQVNGPLEYMNSELKLQDG